MLTALLRRFSSRSQPVETPAKASAGLAGAATVPAAPPKGLDQDLVYPPVDPGLPAASTEAVVQSQADLLRRLRKIVSVDDAVFDERYMAPIRALASEIHLLPASAHEEFAGPGGLFRLCLEVAVFSTQAADGRIFTPDENVERRHALEPRWKYACFLAGLTCELYRPLAFAVVADKGGHQWGKFIQPLSSWLAEKRIDRYWVSWLSGSQSAPSSKAEGGTVVSRILPRTQLAWLDAGSPAINRDIMAIAMGQVRRGDSILGDLVESIRTKVHAHDEATRRSRYGKLRSGNHLEPYILDAFRVEVEAGRWSVNKLDSIAYLGTDGLFVEWPRASDLVKRHLGDLGLKGVPSSPLTLAEVLVKSGACIEQEGGQVVWTIVVSDLSSTAAAEKKTALRFRDPAALGDLKTKAAQRPFTELLVNRVIAEASPAAPASGPAAPAASVFDSLPSVARVLKDPEPGQLPPLGGPGAAQPSAETAPRAEKASPAPAPPSSQPLQQASSSRRDEAAKDAPVVTLAALVPVGVRNQLRPADAEFIGRLVRDYRAGKSDAVIEHSGRQIAVSQDYVEGLDRDFSATVGLFEKKGWLGRPDGAPRGARAAEVPFAHRPCIGFVITAEAAADMGFFSS